jgi:hypothetical protein
VADLYPAELSGGMQKRASLARAIAADPDIIFFDEPTTGLDPIMAGVINDLIRGIVTEMGVTAITITHDMTSARTIADKVAMLHRGKIRWHGDVGTWTTPTDPYLTQFITGAPRGRSRRCDDPHRLDRGRATLFWTYAGLAAIEWFARLSRRERREHLPLFFEMIGHLVPAMITLLVVVLAGAFFGFPTVVVIIAILFPAGLAVGVPHGSQRRAGSDAGRARSRASPSPR